MEQILVDRLPGARRIESKSSPSEGPAKTVKARSEYPCQELSIPSISFDIPCAPMDCAGNFFPPRFPYSQNTNQRMPQPCTFLCPSQQLHEDHREAQRRQYHAGRAVENLRVRLVGKQRRYPRAHQRRDHAYDQRHHVR